MPDQLSEQAAARYISEHISEMTAILKLCPPDARLEFLTYLLEMVSIEAREIFAGHIKHEEGSAKPTAPLES